MGRFGCEIGGGHHDLLRKGAGIGHAKDAELRALRTRIVPTNDKTGIPAGWEGFDCGPETVKQNAAVIARAKTIVWNGPLGAFELPPFDAATVALARTAAALTRDGSLVSVAGGGDTVAALNHAGAAGDFSFVSTAGGAFLEWMEGKPLPGVIALESAD